MNRIPDFETPEQYEKRTGEKLRNNSAVWLRYKHEKYPLGKNYVGWLVDEYERADFLLKDNRHFDVQVLCVSGVNSPPENWEP
jgi:hypothetical protein